MTTDDVTVSGTGEDAEREAFRAGWWVNAAPVESAEDERYFERCEEVDWQEFRKKHPAHSQAFAQGAEAMREAAASLCEDRASNHGWNYNLPSVGRELASLVRALPVPPPSFPEPQKGAGKE